MTPLFGKKLSGPLGSIIDIVAVIATILGVAQTLGFGVEQFVAGMSRIGIGSWLLNSEGNASSLGIIVAIVVIMGASTLSVLSGVGKGIKWLSNLSMALSIFLLGFLMLFGSTWFGIMALFLGMWEYITALPATLFTVYSGDGTGGVSDTLQRWQSAWSVFYWAGGLHLRRLSAIFWHVFPGAAPSGNSYWAH